MPLDKSSTRRSPPKTTPAQTPMQIRTQTQVQLRVQLQIQSPTLRKTKRRHVLLLPAPLLAILLLWLGLILLAHSQLQLQHINNIRLSYIDMSPGPFVHNHNHNSTHRFHRLQQPREVLVLSNKTTTSTDSVSEDPVHDDRASYEIVHIIQTRFMQQQPKLIALGLARLQLFENFFLRSLEEQISTNFLCVIRTDPDLDDLVRQPLLDILEKSSLSQYLLIASNDNPHSHYIDITQDLSANQVWSGSFKEAKTYLGTSEQILETRLDADDALSKLFVKTMQQEVSKQFDFEHSTWRIWCAGRHLEWQYQTAWKGHGDSGSIVSLQFVGCITAGLTTGYRSSGSQQVSFPFAKHQSLYGSVKECGRKNHSPRHNCLSFLQLAPSALRARTPTSAGMLNILWGNQSHKPDVKNKYAAGASKQKAYQEQLWAVVSPLFGFTPATARQVHKYLEQNMQAIAEDNLRGQCTEGHSCKNTSQQLLQEILESPQA